jgi:hypothetical protein
VFIPNTNPDDENVHNDTETTELTVCFINERDLERCPQIKLKFNNRVAVIAICDTGSDVNLLNEHVFEQLINEGTKIPTLPLENIALVTAFGKKTQRIKKQALIEFMIGGDVFESVFLITPQLTNQAILGHQFAREYGIIMNFRNNSFSYARDGKTREVSFSQRQDLIEQHDETRVCEGALVGDESEIYDELITTRDSQYDGILCGKKEDEYDELIAARDDELIATKDSQYNGILCTTKKEEKATGLINQYSLTALNCAHSPEQMQEDARSMSKIELSDLVRRNENLNEYQKGTLNSVLAKYLNFMTSKPGECKNFEYQFQVEGLKNLASNSYPIPFAMRTAVRKQVDQMLEDGVLEISKSPYLNPLTIVQKENKKIRICVDARRINEYIIPDRERSAPIQELVQKFQGAKYMSSLDLSSAFLQVKLHKESRKYTAFLFDSTVYQFKRVPYGFKNSLAAFVRALKTALGSEVEGFVVFYVDDVIIHSKSYDEHLIHLDYVIGRMTKAGFNLNASKCRFCQSEIKFLGHRIDKIGVSADQERIEAIMNYPAPRNAKQLRQLLGTCNFHSRFIVGYANYIAPLLPMLKQGTKWKWTTELQAAFERLRASFASSIHLIHPHDELPYEIYTDASQLGISAVLMQKGEAGEKLIVSTASRVLNPTEQRYSTCEQELLAVVYALQKFRIYVFGHKITVYSDNKALSFLKKCNLTSNRVTRWTMQIQEYDLDIVHISGTANFFADILSRNPVGITKEQLSQAGKPREIFVGAINLNLDKSLKKELKDLARHQSEDLRLVDLRQRVMEDPCSVQERYLIRNHILFVKDNKTYPYWRPVLPKNLEYRVINYVHTLLGHQGTDKCVCHIAHSFYMKNLGRKVRRYVARCDICQRVKHPNRAYEIENRSHLPGKPGKLMTLDLFGPLPRGRGNVRYLLVCLDVFSKHVMLYPLKSATTKSCLNKITSHYFREIIKPEVILSDHGSQFTSPLWKNTLEGLQIQVRYSPIRHPESNPTERIMRELGKYFRIYCNMTHKKWPELVPYITKWLNLSASSSTGYSPMELMYGEPKTDLFREMLKKNQDEQPTEETLETKVLKAYAKMKLKADRRNAKRKKGTVKWEPQLKAKVLVRGQPVSDAAQGLAAKFQRPYEGVFVITKIVSKGMYEISDERGRLRGLFNICHLKPYLSNAELM